jgi:hypothetical protein
VDRSAIGGACILSAGAAVNTVPLFLPMKKLLPNGQQLFCNKKGGQKATQQFYYITAKRALSTVLYPPHGDSPFCTKIAVYFHSIFPIEKRTFPCYSIDNQRAIAQWFK